MLEFYIRVGEGDQYLAKGNKLSPCHANNTIPVPPSKRSYYYFPQDGKLQNMYPNSAVGNVTEITMDDGKGLGKFPGSRLNCEVKFKGKSPKINSSRAAVSVYASRWSSNFKLYETQISFRKNNHLQVFKFEVFLYGHIKQGPTNLLVICCFSAL